MSTTLEPNTTSPPSSGGHLPWLDFAKGLSILLIVTNHATRGLQQAEVLPLNLGMVESIATLALCLGLPMFFFISGMFVTGMVRSSITAFGADRLQKLAYPYVLWVTFFALAQLALTGQTNNDGTLGSITGMLHTPPGHYWFIYAAFVISIAYVVLRKTGFTSTVLMLLAGAAYLSYALGFVSSFSALRYIQGYSVFFALGALIGRRGAVLALTRAPVSVLLPLALVGIGVLAVVGWYNVDDFDEIPWVRLPLGLCGISGGLSLAILLERQRVFRFVGSWGFRSLEIYLAHVHGTAGMRILLLNVFGLGGAALHVSLGIVAGLYLPILLVALSRRLGFPYLFSLKPRKIPDTAARPTMASSPFPAKHHA